MKYRVLYMPQLQKQLKKMGRNQARIIVAWIRKNLEGTFMMGRLFSLSKGANGPGRTK